jgi:hypothetical protein
VGVVCFPGGEEHGQHRDQSGECANLSRPVADSSRLKQTCEGAVEGVDTVAATMLVV